MVAMFCLSAMFFDGLSLSGYGFGIGILSYVETDVPINVCGCTIIGVNIFCFYQLLMSANAEAECSYLVLLGAVRLPG